MCCGWVTAIARRRVFVPEVIRDDDRALVFFKQDEIFGKPKATCQLVIVAPPAYESPAAAVMSDLFAKLVKVTLLVHGRMGVFLLVT